MYSKNYIETLSPEQKRAALASLLKSKASEPQSYPLSSSQRGLWFQQQLDPQSAAWNIPLVVVIATEVHVEMLRQTLDVLVQRHRTLRTVFALGDGEPVQTVRPWEPVVLPVRDLGGAAEDDWKAQLLGLSSEQAGRPMDLATGPMYRFELVKLSPTLYALLAVIHHIALDGWSIGIFQKECRAIYSALAAGRQSTLPPLRAQYSDFVEWERRRLQETTIDTQIAYWKERLRNAPSAFEMPADFPRPAIQTYRGASQTFTISKTLTEGLKALGRQKGATFFMTMFASFSVLLSRFSGQQDIVVGAAVANREREEFWPVLGLFANTVPMRADLSGDPPFGEFLERVRLQALEDYDQATVPWPKLVEELKPARDPGRNVLFQVGFDFQNMPWHVEYSSLKVDPISLLNGDSGSVKLDLNLALSQNENGLTGALEYSTDLFTTQTISKLIESYRRLLESIVENPERRLSDLDILDPAERRRIVESWNQNEQPIESGYCVHQLVEQQALRTPDKTALVHGQTQLTYRRLDQLSNRLAHLLRRAGVGPESKVGVCGERSPNLIVGLLAVMKAGGCFVPLDPALPSERMAWILNDAGASVLLASRRVAQAWTGPAISVVLLDPELSDDPAFSSDEIDPLPNTVSPANLAYIIYTSGSTGHPKGVMVPHSCLANYVAAAGEDFKITPADRVLQFASISFDTSAEEIFPCLVSGATLVLRDDVMLSSGAAFLETCAAWGITVLDLPTAFWQEIVSGIAAEHLSLPPTLRLVIIGGEAALLPDVNTWRGLASANLQLLNTYGPTEATIVATRCDLSRDEFAGKVPIGRPGRNVRVYVVDTHGNLVPPGVYGEIVVGGAGVARGYLNRPDLTPEKFVPDPFATKPGSRLYRTGDIGRYLPGGDLEFKGRVDGQVKLRGYRIELTEIEAVLREHPRVEHAVVILDDRQPGERRLAGYAMCPESGVSVSELRQWLHERLPEYMVPAALVVLDAFPKTVTGKIDRRALLELGPESADVQRSAIAPRTATEEVLAAIWADVLGIENVGALDDFFALGGHSLIATRVLARVRRLFGVDVPLYVIFEGPTIARLAQAIEGARRSQEGFTFPPLVRRPREAGATRFAQSFAQQRLWFLDQLEPQTATYNLPIAMRVQGDLDVKALEQTLNEIIRRHEVLRTTFETHDGLPVQIVASELSPSVPVTDLSGSATDEKLARLASEEAHRSFDLSQGPMLRMQVLKLGESDFVLLFTVHHIVSDAWSMGVLVREFGALYPAFHAGLPSPLPNLEFQYADFAEWQRGWLNGDQLKSQLEYWRAQLEGAPEMLQLPADRPRSAGRSLAGARVSRALGGTLSQSIKTFSRAENVTLFMTMLAGFQTLLHRYTGETDILVGTPVANRYQEELEPLVGFFINTLALRARVAGDPTFRRLLAQVRETALGAYAHQDLPFERLVEELAPERGWTGNPIFQVMFVMQNAPMPDLELPGLNVTALPVDRRTAKFDLTLDVVEYPEGFVTIAEYSTELFDEATIERLLKHYEHLLEAIVKNPETPVSELSMLSEAERA
ncbi:MAG TPA: amino acid adenylation domain-containing protein, partial [Terriglobia bacterium]|nr:amino acid adenylation domain-containing protein [Terriglobia bacterium]